MSNARILRRLLAFMRPLNGIMLLSVSARTVKLTMQTALIAFAAAGVAHYVADTGGSPLTDIVPKPLLPVAGVKRRMSSSWKLNLEPFGLVELTGTDLEPAVLR